jgi:uncharacterized protein
VNGRGAEARFGTRRPRAPQYQGMVTQSTNLLLSDGVRLAVDVVLPQGLPSGARIPALLQQTRYWRDAELRPPLGWFLRPTDFSREMKEYNPFFTSRGYALVSVDVRGTGASFGTWAYPWAVDSVRDAGEIVAWIVAQPWSNGRVGGLGISYLGTTAELLAVTNHPAVKAIAALFNHPDAFCDIAFPGGILNRRFIEIWSRAGQMLDQDRFPPEFGALARLAVRGVKPVDGEHGRRLLAEAIEAHAENGDIFTTADLVAYRDQQDATLGVTMNQIAVHHYQADIVRAAVPVLGWGSWMDAGTADAAIRRFCTLSGATRAVIGAWDHGGLSHASPYQRPTAAVDPSLPGQWAEQMRFFDAYLQDADDGVRGERVLHYYTLGEERWKQTSVWPPQGTAVQRWYLAEGHTLSQSPPAAESGVDTYAVDFQASSGDRNRWWEMGPAHRQTVLYAKRAEAARHLLVYTTAPLPEDVEIAGHPVVTLHVASTEPDCAFYAYLEDVDERGRVTYVTEGQLRAIHRRVCTEPAPYRLQVPYHSFKEADAQPLVPGEMVEITFGLLPTSVLIRRGHRLRLGIAGHDEGTFIRIPATGTPVWTVARNRLHASTIDLPIMQP